MKKVKLTAWSFVLLAVFLIPKMASAQDSIDILNTESENISAWYEGWEDQPPEAKIKVDGTTATIEGASLDKTFGSVHKNVTIDLDEYPVLEIEVTSVNYYWYLVVSGSQFNFDPAAPNVGDGYALLQEATNRVGTLKYNIKKITGLSGEQNFDLQLGVGRPAYNSNVGAVLTIKSLKFIKSEPK